MNTVDILKKLISIPSVFPNEQGISEFIFSHLKDQGFEVRKVKTDNDRYNLVAIFGQKDKYLGFYGHMDTVSCDEISDHDPYTLSIKGDRAWGLGVEDMKGAVSAILQVAEFVKQEKLPVKIILGVDEEGISKGAHDLVDSGLLNDIAFLIVGESGQVKNLNQAFSICYGRKGRILYQVEVFGKKAHAAESTRGINAIEQANSLITAILKMRFPKHLRLGATELIMTGIYADTSSFSIPDRCTFYFSLLTTPNVKSSKVEDNIQSLARRSNINIKISPVKRETPYGESYEVDRNNKFLKILEKEIFEPYQVKPIYTTSVADENVFANRLGIPVISIGPIGEGGHTQDEWVSLKSLAIVEEVYKKIIKLYNFTT